MLLLHAGWLGGVTHAPARKEFAILAFRRIGVVVPRIVGIVTEIAQIRVVWQIIRRAWIGPQSIITFIRLKAALVGVDSFDRVRVDTKARHAHSVSRHVGLADKNHAHAERPQMIADGHLANSQRYAVVGGPV